MISLGTVHFEYWNIAYEKTLSFVAVVSIISIALWGQPFGVPPQTLRLGDDFSRALFRASARVFTEDDARLPTSRGFADGCG